MDVVIPAVVTAPLWIAAGLLVVAGVDKLRVPDGAMATLHSLRLPSGRLAARVLGVGEIVVGGGVVVIGSRLGAVVLATCYALLLAVAWRQRARQLDCGCFGVAAAPVSSLHLGIDAAAVTIGLAGLAAAPLPLGEAAADAGVLGSAAGAILLATAVGMVRALAIHAAEQLRRTPPSPRLAASRSTAAAAGAAP